MRASAGARRTRSSEALSSFFSSAASRSSFGRKYWAIARLSSFTTRSTSVMPFSAASATTYSSAGVVTIGASSFGRVLVNGRKRVPRPAAGINALRTVRLVMFLRLTGHNAAMSRADKQDARDELLQERRALTAEQIEAARAAVRTAVLARQADAGWTTIAAYLPLRTEPGSHEPLVELVHRGVRVLVPVTEPDHDLDWVALPGDEPLGRGAIAAVDAVLVPALA